MGAPRGTHSGESYVEPDMVKKISSRTGISQIKIKKILRIFRISFKKYLKGPMKLPIHIESVFKIYRGVLLKNSSKTQEEIDNWRNLDKDAPYKK
tara:strand:+ start:223 stop:507 length:285 start_codon:yes stop_codon:yes gene_type:complete